jgi:putative transcriptional regulator
VSATALAPTLLIAMDQVLDPNFRRAVVLMLHHEEGEGGFGLVLNRAMDMSVASLCETIELPWNGSDQRQVDWGGPVQPEHGWVLLGEDGLSDPEIEPVASGIRFSCSQNVLRDLASQPPSHFRIFLGYAGWGQDQLEREIADGAWLVVPVSDDLVFDTEHEGLWDAAVRSLGIEPATLVSTQGIN